MWGVGMKYECSKCGKIVQSDEDLHEDPCPDYCGGLLYDSVMLKQERNYYADA